MRRKGKVLFLGMSVIIAHDDLCVSQIFVYISQEWVARESLTKTNPIAAVI